jgi:CRISPR-associated protein Cmr5
MGKFQLGQGRDAFAYEKAKDGCWRHRKEFPQAVKGVPMLIKNNGLGAAFAFMYSKDNTLGTILKAIDAWLSHDSNIHTAYILKNAVGSNLLQKVQDLNSCEYRKLTMETMAFLQLLRRYSEGIYKEEELKKIEKKDDMAQRQETESSRAAFAYDEALKNKNEEFAQLAKKIPMMIKTSGLSETFAFMYSKQKKHGVILNSIYQWLKQSKTTLSIIKNAQGENLVQKVTNLDIAAYRIVTTETMAYLQWLRRFSEGMVKEEKETNQTQSS